MCGIFIFIGDYNSNELKKYYENIQHRGPEGTQICYFDKVLMVFHRLAINDIENGHQPFSNNDVDVICNGEIYNFLDLKYRLKLETKTNSDCEILLPLYQSYGMNLLCRSIDGEFSFVVHDRNKKKIFLARDPFGIRPLFIAKNINNGIIISSEIKAIPNTFEIEHIEPGCFYEINLAFNKPKDHICKTRYYKYVYYTFPNSYNREIKNKIKELLFRSVEKRLISDRPIGVLLSGGLDSSLIAAISCKFLGKALSTFSIGLKDSPDLKNAKEVADFIGSDHHQIELTEKDFLNSIKDVIYAIESYDITTVRASIGNYLVCDYIKKNTDIKVILSGEGADELMGGYLYFKKSPSPEEFNIECVHLLKNIHRFDVLRSDRCISHFGLESRIPFLDKEFVSYYMSIDPKIKSDGNKDLIRNCFASSNLLPDNILKRRKEAFSDGVTENTRSLHKIIKEHLNQDEEIYYLNTFINFFGKKNIGIIPYKWLPKKEWVGPQKDPSARTLDIY